MRSILKTSLFVLLLPAFMHAEDIKEKYHLHDTTWFNPQAGSMLIFPADLRHRVERNCSDEDRISIGFNLKCS